jgi:hypothetical protein
MTRAEFDKLKPGDWVVVVMPYGTSRGGLRRHVGKAFKLSHKKLEAHAGGEVWTTVPFDSTVTVRSRAVAASFGHQLPGTYKVKRTLGLEPIDCELPDRSRYPHSCLRCGAPAFIGLQVDCMNRCR